MRANDDWKGVADDAMCARCPYRSICRDSAARGEPAWPVLATDVREGVNPQINSPDD